MRKLVGSLLAAGAIAAMAVAPVAAELEFCISDPPVYVDGAKIDVGLYTHDANLVAAGGIPQNLPIFVTLLGSREGTISTDTSAWQATRPNIRVAVFNALPYEGKRGTETVQIDALVPSSLRGDSFYIKVQMPDGSVKTASAPVNHLARLRVQVPVQGGGNNNGGNDGAHGGKQG